MTSSTDLFVEEARGVTVVEAGLALGILTQTQKNHAGPCPHCGGNDRFSINVTMGAWRCRQCDGKGRDGISLFALANGHDVRTRKGFLAACSDALGGKPIPDMAEKESDEERHARLDRIAAQKKRNQEAAAKNAKDGNIYRQREVDKARGIYLRAPETPGFELLTYLHKRTGFQMNAAVFVNLRFAPACTYWHGKDERGYEISHHVGPAMIAPFINLQGHITGCHQTWIDLDHAPKFRPDLGTDDKGKPLPTKKMRGTKMGSLIPLYGLMTSARWVGGEGIENGLTIAGTEGFRTDTFYFAAGDLGNLSGPADPKSHFAHPHDTYEDKAHRIRAVRVAGPVPKPNQSPDEAMQVPDHVTELILLADGDSEKWMTASCVARAEARLAREGLSVWTWWAPDGTDFSELMTGN